MSIIREIYLEGYDARTKGGATLILGTAASYGIEQLHINAGPGWEGLAILATFVTPTSSTRMACNSSGMVTVPPEATAEACSSAKIVFVGVADGVQRITVDLPYLVADHAPIEGQESAATPSEWAQYVVQAAAEADRAEKAALNVVAAVGAAGAEQIDRIQAAADEITAELDALDLAACVIVCNAEGSPIVVHDSAKAHLRGLQVYGRTTQDGTPTPDAPAELVSVENPTVKVDDQTLLIPYTLCGIPVASGGNYTDANGQEWICDEVDFDRGVYVQRITCLTLPVAEMNNEEEFPGWKHVTQIFADFPNQNILLTKIASAMCNGIDPANIGINTTIKNDTNNSKIWLQKTGLTQTEWIAMYPELTFTIFYTSPAAIETPLTAEQITAYKALLTNYPSTTILNDAGAHMAAAYLADPKIYIDNKLKA